MSALREIIAKFGVEFDDHELKEGEKGINGLIEKLKGFGEALAAAFVVEKIHSFIEGQIAAGAELKKTSEKLGVETDELQALQLAANEAGVSSESLATGLRFLNRNISEAAGKGGEHAALFKKLGISLKEADGTARPAGDVMEDLADSIASIQDPARQVEVAMKLLGRGGVELLPLLKQGGQAFEDARKKMVALGGGMSKEFVEQSHQAEKANVDLKVAMMGLESAIATAIIPTFVKLVDAGTKIAVEFQAMAKHTGVVKAAFAGFFVTAALLAPQVTLIAAAGVVLWAAFHELYRLLEGKDSVVGDALGPDKEAIVAQLRESVETLSGAVDELGAAFSGTDEGTSGFVQALVIITGVVGGLIELFAKLIKALESVGGLWRDVFGGDFERAFAALTGLFGGEGTEGLDKEREAKERQQGHDSRVAYLKKTHPELSDSEIAAKMAANDEATWARQRGRGARGAYNRGELTGPPPAAAPEDIWHPDKSARYAGESMDEWRARVAPQHVVAPFAVRPGRVVVPGHGGHAAVKNNIVHQNNAINVEVHGADVSDPNGIKSAVGSAVGPAIATSTQRGMSRANIANDKP